MARKVGPMTSPIEVLSSPPTSPDVVEIFSSAPSSPDGCHVAPERPPPVFFMELMRPFFEEVEKEKREEEEKQRAAQEEKERLDSTRGPPGNPNFAEPLLLV